MDYSRLLNRAWEIIWRYPFLILMGVLAAFSGSPGGGGGGGGTGFQFGGRETPQQMPEFPQMPQMPQMPEMAPFQMPPFDGAGPWLGAGAALGLLLVCLALIIGIVLWIVGTIARGGLVAGVDTIESGGTSRFGEAWRAGQQRAGSLIGISLVPAIPALILFIGGLGSVGIFGVSLYALGEQAVRFPLAALAGVFGLLTCIVLPIALILGLLRTFAERACMLEGLGVVDSYRRGVEVLMANLGTAVVLFLIQIVISLVVGLVLLIPGAIVALCFLLWPLLWLVNGFIAAYFSTLWTLAWREWTLAPPAPTTSTV
jgi:hypothetical protein